MATGRLLAAALALALTGCSGGDNDPRPTPPITAAVTSGHVGGTASTSFSQGGGGPAAEDPWAMPTMPPEADRWVDPAICGPHGDRKAVGPCSKNPRADGNADLLDANGAVIGILTPDTVSCGPGRDFIPGPCVQRPGPNGTRTYHDANGRQIGVGTS